MGSQKKNLSCFLPLLALAVVLSLCLGFVDAATSLQKPVKLQWHYYKHHNTCKNAETFVQHQVNQSWSNDKSIAAKLLRLASMDCLVTGCDASILLIHGPDAEITAIQNRGLGGVLLIHKIKTVLEQRCPGVVSCADIIQLAARDAVHLAGAPSYPVYTGRRDGMTSKASSVDIPSPSISLEAATAYFKSKGLDVLDMVTLLGAHTMGRTHCRNIEDRLYNYSGTGKPDPTMDPYLSEEMKKKCPERVKKGQGDPLVYLNPESGAHYNFTESYYRRISNNSAVLGIDQQLLYGNDTKEITKEFASGFEDFRKSWALSMSRMGSINVLTGNQGEIRLNCSFTNKDNPYLK
ncbi:putative peroxidase 61 [Morus notabilis]|uniref:Peroxidase n=1 Tax=Morus notabilis TaxID=981085 RepID=W9SB04_9ROSA|nr:probable peroxidase 61 [Morus notabilis]EXC33981.1 putative peroxidase 61 [Morus notabilis]